MTYKEIFFVSQILTRYHKIANIPDELNNIIIDGDIISLIENGKTVVSRKLDVDILKKSLEKTVYQKNIFNQSDSKYNPFEADRKENEFVWSAKYKHIDFPKFISVLLFSLLAIGKIPDIIDFCKIYLLTYTEAIDVRYSNPMRFCLYAVALKNDRERVGQNIIFTDGQILPNHLLRFKASYLRYVKDLPINEFTTEHLCSRIYKVYGSIVRDIYNVLYFNKLGMKSYYNFLDDLSGIDLILDGVPVFAYTNTISGQEFRKKKREERHPELADIGIALEKNVYSEKTGGVYLINQKKAEETILKVKQINNGLRKILKVSF